MCCLAHWIPSTIRSTATQRIAEKNLPRHFGDSAFSCFKVNISGYRLGASGLETFCLAIFSAISPPSAAREALVQQFPVQFELFLLGTKCGGGTCSSGGVFVAPGIFTV